MTVVVALSCPAYNFLAVDAVALVPPSAGRAVNRRLVDKLWSLPGDVYATLVGDEIIRFAVQLVNNWTVDTCNTIDFTKSAAIDWVIEAANRVRRGYESTGTTLINCEQSTIYFVSRMTAWCWTIGFKASTSHYYRLPSKPTPLRSGHLLTNYGGDTTSTKVAFDPHEALVEASKCIESLHSENEKIGRSLPYDPRGRVSGVVAPRDEWRRIVRSLPFKELSEQIAGACGYVDQLDDKEPQWSPT